MAEELRIKIPYTPRPGQLQLHGELDKHRWAVVVIHRRFGKTYMLLNQMVKKALTCTKEHPRYAYVAPFLKQAKKIAWEYLKRFCDPIPGRKFSESDLTVTLPQNDSKISLFGADNPDSIRGVYFDGAVMDEYAMTNPKIFSSIIRPALSDRLGWCIFSGTPNGRNHFFDILQSARRDKTWFTAVLKASETGVVPQQELADARTVMTEEEYDREYECSFDSIIGKKIYPEYRADIHISDYSLHPDRPTTIHRGWDNTGLHPGIVLSWLNQQGQWLLFKEFWWEDMGSKEAAESVITWCNLNLPPGCRYMDYADPAGKHRDGNKMSPHIYIAMKSEEMGSRIHFIDGIQTWKVRRESVADKLRSLRNGQPSLLVDFEGCPLCIEGFSGGYAYRELAGLPGHYVEEAIKNKYADCFVGSTVVLTKRGEKRISDVHIGERVWTPTGYRTVTATMSSIVPKTLILLFSNGISLQCTEDHEFHTQKGIVLAKDLDYTTPIITPYSKGEKLWADQALEKNRSSTGLISMKTRWATLSTKLTEALRCTCTGMFGFSSKERYPSVCGYTTWTTINQTTISTTSPLFQQKTMEGIIPNLDLKKTLSNLREQLEQRRQQLQSGTDPQRAESGTVSTANNAGLGKKKKHLNARYVENPSKRLLKPKKEGSAPQVARTRRGGLAEWIMSSELVLFARRVLQSIGIVKGRPVDIVVVSKLYEKKHLRVYDLTVAGAHVFYANGVLVSNCHDAIQYMATRMFTTGNEAPSEDYFNSKDYDDEEYYEPPQTGRSKHTGY